MYSRLRRIKKMAQSSFVDGEYNQLSARLRLDVLLSKIRVEGTRCRSEKCRSESSDGREADLLHTKQD
jgi:hypothetical protein